MNEEEKVWQVYVTLFRFPQARKDWSRINGKDRADRCMAWRRKPYKSTTPQFDYYHWFGSHSHGPRAMAVHYHVRKRWKRCNTDTLRLLDERLRQ